MIILLICFLIPILYFYYNKIKYNEKEFFNSVIIFIVLFWFFLIGKTIISASNVEMTMTEYSLENINNNNYVISDKDYYFFYYYNEDEKIIGEKIKQKYVKLYYKKDCNATVKISNNEFKSPILRFLFGKPFIEDNDILYIIVIPEEENIAYEEN